MSEAEEIKRLRMLVDEGMKFKHRMQRVALAEEDKGVPVSVCDYCEETYPESWIVNGICPYCGHAHNEENEEAIGGSSQKHASYCPVCDQYVPDGVGIIEDIIVSSGSIEYDFKNSVVMNTIGCYIHSLLKESGSPNFITSSLGETKEVGTLVSDRHKIYFTFGWANKKTPADIINELRKQVAELTKVLSEKRTYACLSENELAQILKELMSDLRFPQWNNPESCNDIAKVIMDNARVVVADELDWLKNYVLFKQDPQEFLDKLNDVWKHEYGRMTVSKQEDGKAVVLELATGGWSENEEIILAMKLNYVLWSLYWVESGRGGYFKFEFPLN